MHQFPSLARRACMSSLLAFRKVTIKAANCGRSYPHITMACIDVPRVAISESERKDIAGSIGFNVIEEDA